MSKIEEIKQKDQAILKFIDGNIEWFHGRDLHNYPATIEAYCHLVEERREHIIYMQDLSNHFSRYGSTDLENYLKESKPND